MRLLLLAIVAVLAASCWTAEEQSVANLHSQIRVDHGLHGLAQNGDLAAYADERCFEITQHFSHSGWSPRPGWAWSGENVAAGFNSPSAVINGWMGSSPHRDNILFGPFSQIGVGHCTAGGRHYWVVEFAG